MDYLRRALTTEEVVEREGQICEVVRVKLDEIIFNDFECLLDLLSELVLGNYMLQEIGYKAVGIEDEDILIEVTGYIDEDDMEELMEE